MNYSPYWGIIYVVMKSLGINELELDDNAYLKVTPDNIDSMIFARDIKTGKTKVIIKEK